MITKTQIRRLPKQELFKVILEKRIDNQFYSVVELAHSREEAERRLSELVEIHTESTDREGHEVVVQRGWGKRYVRITDWRLGKNRPEDQNDIGKTAVALFREAGDWFGRIVTFNNAEVMPVSTFYKSC